MIDIEKNVEDALYKSAYQGLKIYFEPLKGKPFHITSLDIVEGSFQIKKTATSTNNIQIGNMSADDLSMELMNPTDSWGIGKFDDVYFCGATMRLYLLVYDQAQDKMTETPFGVYIIDNQPRALDTIKITAFSNVIRLDTPFTTNGFLELTTLYELVDKGLERAGLDHDDSIQVFPDTALGMLYITQIKSEQTITWRQVIKWCCECAGVNAISDENGVIKFVFYDKYTPDVLLDEEALNLTTEDGEILLIDDTPTTDFQLTPALRYADNSSEVAEEDVVITGFQFKVDDALYPEDAVMDYGLQSENNIVFYALLERARRRVAKTVNEKLAGFTYRPFKCNTISFPHLQTFDSVVYIKDGKRYHSIITDIVYKLNGDMTLTAKGKNKEQKAWEVLGALTPKQQAIIDSVSRKIDTTRQDLNAREQFLILFNEAITGSMGFYSTVVEKENGAKISYMHDKSTLEASKIIYTFSEQGFAWTTDGWNNGEPIWHYGFDKNGNAILNAIYAYKLTADVIVSGKLLSKNGASYISLDDGTFSFRSATQTGTDANDNPIYKYEDKLTLDENGTLGVYGALRSIQSNYSAFIGDDSDYDAEVDGIGIPIFRLTKDLSRKDKDVFQIADSSFEEYDSIELRFPFLRSSVGAFNPGMRFYSDEVSIVDSNTECFYLGVGKTGYTETMLSNGIAKFGILRDTISVSGNHLNDIWFNYYEPYSHYTTKYHFGTGYQQGYAVLYAAGFNNVSDPALKENIQEISELNALDKIMALKFYSYDYKSPSDTVQHSIHVSEKCGKRVAQEELTPPNLIHTEIGIMATEAPQEIQSTDGKAIDLYAYINLLAKSVQELAEKNKELEEKIKQLESANQSTGEYNSSI